MSDSATTPTPDLRDVVNRDAARLIEHLRCRKAPEEALGAATAHIQQAIDVLRPWLKEGEGWSTISIAEENSGLAWDEQDITSVMPCSPVSGKHNPVAPPIRLWRDGNEVRGEVVFWPTYAGPPNSVHGGIIAAVFDEILAMANVISGNAGFTGTLNIRYHAPTPLNKPVQLWGANVKTEDRKQISRGERHVDGKLTASAEGLFIMAPAKKD